jgi:hypothetical protein
VEDQDTRAALDTMPAAKASAGEERRKAAVGDDQTAANWRHDSDDDDEKRAFPRRSRGDSNARPAVPKGCPEDAAGEEDGGDCLRFPRGCDGGRSSFE